MRYLPKHMIVPRALICVMCAPFATVAAQAVAERSVRPAARPSVATHWPAKGACASIAGGPSELTSTPEGKAVLRLKQELAGVTTVIEQRGASADGVDMRRMTEVKRGVDSLMNVIVRYHNADGSIGPTITVTRGDSGRMTVNGRVLDAGVFEAMDNSMKKLLPEMVTVFADARPRQETVEVRLRALEPQIAEMTRSVNSKASPSGYLGLTLSGSQIRIVTDSGSITAHCDYPMIEAVDVGSPARSAGLSAGDTVIAYNGRDIVAQVVNYPQLLMPGNVVRVKVRRDGKLRETPVTVAERRPDVTESAMRFPLGGVVSTGSASPVTSATSRPNSGGIIVRTVPRSPMSPMSPMPPMVAASVVGGASMTILFGAQLSAVDDEFAKTLGVEPGILILRVQPGSPAAEAGLRGGEIIRAVNGAPVRDLALLHRAMRVPRVHDVKLTVSGRDTPARIVILRF